MNAIVILLDGALAPKTDAGTMAGAAMPLRNCLLDVLMGDTSLSPRAR
jgi:hypothetical protein